MNRTSRTLDATTVDQLIERAVEAGVDIRLTDTGTWRFDGLEGLPVELRESFYQLPTERLVAGLRRYVERPRARV
jgi:hypothetical protein